jgi:hypothetical protein
MACENKIDGPPRTFAKSQTHPPNSRFFPLDFFSKGSSKTPESYLTHPPTTGVTDFLVAGPLEGLDSDQQQLQEELDQCGLQGKLPLGRVREAKRAMNWA